MAQYNKNTEEYLQRNKSLFEVNMLATANGEPVSASNPLPATLGSDTITITGSVNVPTSVEINNDAGNPIPVNGTVNAIFAEGANKPWNLQVAQGLVTGHTFNHKFGAVPNMSNRTLGSVWDVDDTVYPWDALGAGSVINVERNDVADNGNVVTIQGLDENWNYAEETITITSENQSGTQLFRRVNRAFVTQGTNLGDIDIEAGTSGGTTVARITAGLGQTLMALYTVPAGKTGYLYQGNLSAESGKDATGFMFVRYFGQNNFRVGHTFEVFGNAGSYSHIFSFPIPIPERSDIDVRVETRDNNGRYTAAFDILLVDNA